MKLTITQKTKKEALKFITDHKAAMDKLKIKEILWLTALIEQKDRRRW